MFVGTTKAVVYALVTMVLLAVFALAPLALQAQSVTQGYNSDKTLQRGTIVSLDAEDTNKVVATTRENQERLHGVVVAPNDASFTLSDDDEKTFVATVGRFEGFVSTEGGTVQPGDFLSVSTITGIAKKANDKDLNTIGKAIEGFNGEGAVSTTAITDSAGNTTEIQVGRILVDVSVSTNPLLKPTESNLPKFLERATEAIAGKEVSPVRVYIGLAILVLSSMVSGSLLYSGVRSSLISLGRNPLSKKSIRKGLFQIILTSILIFLFGLFGVYLLLRL